MSISLKEIAALIGAELIFAPNAKEDTQISGISSPTEATTSDITFISSSAYLPLLAESKAAAVIIESKFVKESPISTLLHPHPYLAYAKISALFAFRPASEGIHCTVVVDESATIGKNVIIGPNTVVGAHAKIDERVTIGSNVSIGEHAKIGERTVIHSNVTCYHDVSLGTDCIVHSGTVIGADGFGFAPSEKGWVKIYQLGSVRIGNAVEIGANCSIDRGAIGSTVIADGVKMDNLIQIGHNVEIGENTAIVSQTGIAGSTKIGKNCMFAGQVGIVGHIEVADNVTVTGQSMITKSIEASGVYSSGTSFSEAPAWRKNAVRFQQLDKLFKRLVKLEKKVGIK